MADKPDGVGEATPERINGVRTARFKQADVKRALKAARDANISIARVRIEPDGTIEIIQGEPQPPSVANAWDE